MNHKHEEYLAWIDEHVANIKGLVELDGVAMGSGWVREHHVILSSLLANRDVLVRHAPEIRYTLEDCDGSWDSEQEAKDSSDLSPDDPELEVSTFTICEECGGINTEVQEDADEWVYLPEVYFPCPTYADVTKRLDEIEKESSWT